MKRGKGVFIVEGLHQLFRKVGVNISLAIREFWQFKWAQRDEWRQPSIYAAHNQVGFSSIFKR
jgi:hypothetical protein